MFEKACTPGSENWGLSGDQGVDDGVRQALASPRPLRVSLIRPTKACSRAVMGPPRDETFSEWAVAANSKPEQTPTRMRTVLYWSYPLVCG